MEKVIGVSAITKRKHDLRIQEIRQIKIDASLFFEREKDRHKSSKNCIRKRSTTVVVGFTRERSGPPQI